MSYLTQWEKILLSSLLDRYESGDFNCGANNSEMKSVGCVKALDTGDIYLDLPCNKCKFRKRFLKLKNKLIAGQSS